MSQCSSTTTVSTSSARALDWVKLMFYRLLPALMLPLVLLIAGCGGGGDAPDPIPGDFFPLDIGRTWNFDVTFMVNGQGHVLDGEGTMTRTLVGQEDIVLDGDTVSTYVFEHVYSLTEAPTLDVFGEPALRSALQMLFAPDGGLQTVRSYYTVAPGAVQGSDRITLVAISEGGGPLRPIPAPRPYFLNPPFHGHMYHASRCFQNMPLMPPFDTLSAPRATEKLLRYGVTGGPAGPNMTAVSICYFQSKFSRNGFNGSINGRMRTFYQNTVGMSANQSELSDWSATIDVAGGRAIVTSTIQFAD